MSGRQVMFRSIHRNAFRTEEDLPKILTDDTASGKPQLEYPFEAPPNRGATIDVASGVRWIRMPLRYALDHVNLWAIDEANGCAVIDTGLNNEETLLAWQTILIWSGTYHTAMEGALRVPFMIRWPGFVEPGRVTNEILHVTDLFPTLARTAGLEIPRDRPLDGVDQLDFILGKTEKLKREGFVYYIKSEMRAAKWRDWKMQVVWESEPNDGAKHLETPYLFNVVQDPKEESDVNSTQGWVRGPIRKMICAFDESLKAHPPIPPGAPDEYVPKS